RLRPGRQPQKAPQSARHRRYLEGRQGGRIGTGGTGSSGRGSLAVRIALDTNRYVDLCRGRSETVALLEEAEIVFLPYIVLGELRAGFVHGRRQADNERTLRQFLLTDGVQVLFPDEQTTHHYAAIFHQLRKQGTPIPTNDMWLAALVLQHNVTLHARDQHFDHLPQLVRV